MILPHMRRFDDDQAGPSRRSGRIVIDQALGDRPVLIGQQRRHGRHSDPVADGDRAYFQRLE